MGKSVQYLSAKIKPDSGGTLIHPSVMSGKTAFENSREVFFPDTDSAVFDDDKSRLSMRLFSMRLFSLPVQPVDLNRPVLCIFQRIGQNLFKNEGKPFFVRDFMQRKFFQRKRKAASDKQNGIFPDCRPQYCGDILRLKQQIRRNTVQSRIVQRHFRILLDFEKLFELLFFPL